jgi:Trypsin-like peptidase domain
LVETKRAVLLRYTRDGQPRRGSGLRVGGHYVLTADHCADGTDHVVVTVDGQEHDAEIFVRTCSMSMDLAVLIVPELPPVDVLDCALVDRTVAADIGGCQALGFPVWKDREDGPRLAQVDGEIPTAEGADPQAAEGTMPPISLKIMNQQIRERPVLKGDIDQAGSPWAGMSGAVISTSQDLIVGVVRGHSPSEGIGSLTATPLEALIGAPPSITRLFWTALNITDLARLPRLPLTDSTVRALMRILQLEQSGYLNRDAVTQLQVQVVLKEFQGDLG